VSAPLAITVRISPASEANSATLTLRIGGQDRTTEFLGGATAQIEGDAVVYRHPDVLPMVTDPAAAFYLRASVAPAGGGSTSCCRRW
jgi:hypothetical protein